MSSEANLTQKFSSKKVWLVILTLVVIVIALGITALTFNIARTKFFRTQGLTKGATYEGTWKSPGYKGMYTKIEITSVENNKAAIKYYWADETENGTLDITGYISADGKKLTWGNLDNKTYLPYYSFTLTPEGNLKGRRELSKWISTITMTPN